MAATELPRWVSGSVTALGPSSPIHMGSERAVQHLAPRLGVNGRLHSEGLNRNGYELFHRNARRRYMKTVVLGHPTFSYVKMWK